MPAHVDRFTGGPADAQSGPSSARCTTLDIFTADDTGYITGASDAAASQVR